MYFKHSLELLVSFSVASTFLCLQLTATSCNCTLSTWYLLRASRVEASWQSSKVAGLGA